MEEDATIQFVIDEEIQSQVVELISENLSKTYITCPINPVLTLGITLPHVTFIVKSVTLNFYVSMKAVIPKK